MEQLVVRRIILRVEHYDSFAIAEYVFRHHTQPKLHHNELISYCNISAVFMYIHSDKGIRSTAETVARSHVHINFHVHAFQKFNFTRNVTFTQAPLLDLQFVQDRHGFEFVSR